MTRRPLPSTPTTFDGALRRAPGAFGAVFRQASLPLLLAAVMLLLIPIQGSAQVDAERALDGFDAWVTETMKEWKVPGLGVAIIYRGEVIRAEGYGYRDLAKRLPADGDTLFAIGSNSKSFTATVLAMLEDEGRLDWQEPVREYLPTFRLRDAVATEQMTAIDLLSHRSGLPRHDLAWYGSPKTRQELFAVLRHLEPTAPFRSRFQYQNLMFLTAGLLAEEISGKTWEVLVDERIFSPLGMERSNFTVDAMQADANHAIPHFHVDDSEIEQIPFRNIDAIGPAGSINSSAREMARYVLLHMNLGETGAGERAQRLLSAENAALMQSPQMVITGPLRARFAGYSEIGEPTYGLGLMISSYHGRRHVYHGGGIDGFISAMEWLPDDDIGVVVLSNTNGSGTVPTIVARNVFDRLLGLEPVDWSARARKQLDEAREAAESTKAQSTDARHPATSPSHALADYAGTYSHAAYGDIEVVVADDALRLETVAATLPLEHYHYDVFAAPEDLSGPTAGFAGAKVQFFYSKSGDIDRVTVPLEPTSDDIEFIRRAADSLTDPEFLDRLVGEYRLGSLTATVQRDQQRLFLEVTGQPRYSLVPDAPGVTFRIEQLEGFRVEFDVPSGAGPATTLVSHQPNGSFAASRIDG